MSIKREDLNKTNRDIAKEARKDKKQHLVEQFNENPNDANTKYLWRSVKAIKAKFCPRFIKMKSKHGKHVPLVKRSEAIAEYLADIHWNNDSPTNDQEPMDMQQIFNNIRCNTTPLTLTELDKASKSSKNNKQPGPDNVSMELLKWLSEENRQRLLELLNNWWINKDAPAELFLARVVPI